MTEVLARIPVRIPLVVASGAGNVLAAALPGLLMGPSRDPGSAYEILLPDDLPAADAAERLDAAAATLKGQPYTPAERDPLAEHLHIGHVREHPHGGISVGIGGDEEGIATQEEVAKHFLGLALPHLDEAGATNYLEWTLHAPGGERFAVIVTRPSGKTPHELRAQAEAERDAVLARLDAVLELHPRVEYGDGPVCGRCLESDEEPTPWPCPTVVAAGVTG